MELYKNLSGNSPVQAFENGESSIIVRYKGGRTYLYTHRASGVSNVERMKEMALNGRGLGTFINQHVRNKYAKRLK